MPDTKTKLAAAPQTALDRVLSDTAAVAEAAEQLLWAMADGHHPTAAERRILTLAGFVDRNELDREVGRIGAIKQHLESAGTQADLVAAEEAADTATAALCNEKPALEEQRDVLTAKIKKLEADELAACGARDKLLDHREKLRTVHLLPQHVRENYENDRSGLMSNDTAKEINAINQEIRNIDQLMQIDLASLDGQVRARLHCETAMPHLIAKKIRVAQGGNAVQEEVVALDSFDSYRRGRFEKERPKLERKLVELKASFADQLSSAERHREHYVAKIP